MAGVWYFNDGVARCVANPFATEACGGVTGVTQRKKILVHCPSNEIMTSFEQLDEKLLCLGWRPYRRDAADTTSAGGTLQQQQPQQPQRQYHLCAYSPDLLTLPATFNGMRTMHMYDIVVKTRSTFQVRDAL